MEVEVDEYGVSIVYVYEPQLGVAHWVGSFLYNSRCQYVYLYAHTGFDQHVARRTAQLAGRSHWWWD